MQIRKVRSKKDMKAFVRLPKALFGDSDCYMPPIWLDENKAITKPANIITITGNTHGEQEQSTNKN